MNDTLVEILEALQAESHTLEELKNFVCRDEFQMKHAYQEAPESSDLHILYDSLLCVIDLVSDLNSRCDAAIQQINNPFCDWIEVYASEYESILLASFTFSIFDEDCPDDDFVRLSFPTWIIHKNDLTSTIQFLKMYAIMSDFYLLKNEREILKLLAL